jgi:hypothetical protein
MNQKNQHNPRSKKKNNTQPGATTTANRDQKIGPNTKTQNTKASKGYKSFKQKWFAVRI